VRSRRNPEHWPIKRQVYPLWTVGRSLEANRWLPGVIRTPKVDSAEMCFVVENQTAAGLGTLLPLISHPGTGKAMVLVTDRVARTASRFAGKFPHKSWLRLGEWVLRGKDGRAISIRCDRLKDAMRSHGMADEADLLGPILRTLVRGASHLCEALTRCMEGAPGLRCVVTHNDFMPATFLAGALARKSSLTEVTLQHGMPVLEYAPISTGRYLVWGGEARDWFLRTGARGSALRVSGCPRFDRLFAEIPSAEPIPRRRVLLVVSQTHSPVCGLETHIAFIRALSSAALQLGQDWRVIVKLHPLEGQELYRKVLGNHTPPNMTFTRAGELWELLRAASAIFGSCSTAMIEAMIASRPVLVFRSADDQSTVYGSGMDGTVVGNGSDLAESIARLANDDAFVKRVLARQELRLDGLFGFRGCAVNETLRNLDSRA
jgi:hypothetical protein